MADIEREIERIIRERDFGGWDAESLAAVKQAAAEWAADMARRSQRQERRRTARYKRK